MARQKRLHVPHGTYYVVDRFTPGLEILAARADRAHTPADLARLANNRQHFETQLSVVVQRWGAQVDAHCWLPDAALLVIKVSLASLECVMHSLHGTFSHYLHTTAGITGRPYPGRYRALLVDPDAHLLTFGRYVLTAPVRLGLTRTAQAYPFSSLSSWAGPACPGFLAHSRIRHQLARAGRLAPAGLERFLTERPAPGFLALLRQGSPLDHRIAGDPAFVRAIHEKSGQIRRVVHIDGATRWASELAAIDLKVVNSPKRSHDKALARTLAAWLITSSGAASLSEVARSIACCKSTLHKGIERNLRLRPELFNQATLRRYLDSPETPGETNCAKETPGTNFNALPVLNRTRGAGVSAAESGAEWPKPAFFL